MDNVKIIEPKKTDDEVLIEKLNEVIEKQKELNIRLEKLREIKRAK